MTKVTPRRLNHPGAERRPETVTFGPVTYVDSYRWLEEDNDLVRSWQDAQNTFAGSHLTALPAYEAFQARLARFEGSELISAPKTTGGRWFRQYVPDDQNLAVVEMSESPSGGGRRVVDLNAMQTNEPLSLDAFGFSGFVPSPDGRKAILSWTRAGREEPHVRVFDVDSGETLLDGIPHKKPMVFAWLPDGSGFIYFALDYAANGGPSLFRIILDRPAEATPEAVTVSHPVAFPRACADARHLLLAVDHLAPRPEYIFDTRDEKVWRPFLKGISGIFRGDVLGERFIAITDDGAPRGRLVSIPLATPTMRETWREIVPESEHVLGTVVITGGRIVLLDLVDTYSRLRVFDAQGRFEGEIALPGRGVITNNGAMSYYQMFNMVDPIVSGQDGEVIFVFSTFGQAPALYRADVVTRKLAAMGERPHTLDVQVSDFVCTSADRARVSYHVIARRDIDLSHKPPTVIHGYGGFNISVVPGWLGARWATWIEAGGVIVLAHLRGGGEYGTDWWDQGRLKLKQNTYNDVHAVAEDLISRGLASADTLGVMGASNGGVMAAAVATQRPDLYRAIVAQVPITDALGRARDPATMVSTLDYGDPADPEMADILYRWSPYQNVRDHVPYPAVLVDCGSNDRGCPPWHSRKFVARLQHATSSDHPVLLRVRMDAGHAPIGKKQRQSQSAEMLAFLADQLGLAVE